MSILPHALALSGLLMGAPAAPPRGLPEPVVPDPFGVNIHFVVPNEQEADTLAAGGFRFIRMDFNWGGIEKEKGKYDFSGYDKLVEGLSRRGIRALFILDYGNRLYDNGESPRTEEGRAGFAKWAAAAAKHYAGKGILWEIWNEPNISFWKPTPNVEDYSKLCLAVIAAVRQADPQAFILAPASSTFPWDFYTVMGERGVIAKLDAFSVHPYRQSNPETVQADYRRLRVLLDHYSPKRHIPIVSGEWGYTTVWGGITDERQAQYLVRQWLTNMANGVGPSIWYDWHDDGVDPKEGEHHFGTVYHDYKPKPSYLAARTISNTLRGYRFLRRASLGSDDDYALVFRKGDAVALAAWTTANAHAATLALPAGQAKIVSILGEERAATVDGAGLSLELSGSPQYVLLNSPEALKTLAFWSLGEPTLTIRAGQPAALHVQVENPLAGSLSVNLALRSGESVLGRTQVRLRKGQRSLVALPLRAAGRDRDMIAAQLEVSAGKAHPLDRSPVWLMVANPLPMTVLPVVGSHVAVRIENPSGEPVKGLLRASAGAIQASAPIAIPAGEKEVIVPLDLPAAPPAGVPVLVEGTDAAGARLWPPTQSAWRPVLPIPPLQGTWAAHLEGDAKVPGQVEVAVANAPAGLPLPGLNQALEVRYRFGAGWKFAVVTPPKEATAIEGKPAYVGFWVFGDGEGHSLRCRFIDSTGQTFQPDFGPIRWKGWRFVTMPMDGRSAGHWAGANDGVVHYPIHWDTPLLIDSNRQAVNHDSQLYVTGFALE